MMWLEKQMLKLNLWSMTKKFNLAILEQSNIEVAKILILAQCFRGKISESWKGFIDVIDNPIYCDEDDIFHLILHLLQVIEAQKQQLSILKNSCENMELEFPEYFEFHIHECRWGLELWICSLGVGIYPQNIENMEKIWKKLSASKNDLIPALEELKEFEKVIHSAAGTFSEENDLCFTHLQLAEVNKLCEFVPQIFQNRVRVD